MAVMDIVHYQQIIMKLTEIEHHPMQEAGPRLNKKTVLSTYGDFHVNDKTAARTSYL